MKKLLMLCTTDSMIWNFLIPHINTLVDMGVDVECACSKTGIYFDELRNKYGIKVWEIPFKRSPYSIRNVIAIRKLNNLVKTQGYDTVFCHEPVGGAMGRIVGKWNNCKVIYMAHGFHFYKGAPKVNWLIYYNVEKYLSYFTDELIVINYEDYLAAMKFGSKHVDLINGIGIDTDKFQKKNCNYIRGKYNLTNNNFVLLSVGELIPRKNHEVIIKAIAQLKNKDIHYFIAGEGELSCYLKNLVKEYKLEENVHFLGFCKNVNELCNSCDLFVFPSVQEGLSVAVMEAMACGKAVLASEIRGNVDLIDNGKGGYLVSVYDVVEYATKISNFINDKSLINVFGNYNIKKIKMFDIKKVKSQMGKIYSVFFLKEWQN